MQRIRIPPAAYGRRHREGPAWRYPRLASCPYSDLQLHVYPGGMLREIAFATGKRIVFYCPFGERSAMAVQAAQVSRLVSTWHIEGGIDTCKKTSCAAD